MPITKSNMPSLLLDPNNIFASIFKEDSKNITKLSGILINTLEILKSETLDALKSGKVVDGLPPLYPVLFTPLNLRRKQTVGY